MPMYVYEKDGSQIHSQTPPRDGRPCTAYTGNDTIGMAVCMSVAEWERQLEKRRQDAFDSDWRRAAKQAEADCERELRDKHAAARKALEKRREVTRARWYDAVNKVDEARQAVAKNLEALNDLRWWHDKIHDAAALGLDAAALAIPATSWTVAARLIAMGAVTLASAGNSLGKGAPDIAAGQGGGAYFDAGLGAAGDAADVYEILAGKGIPGGGLVGGVATAKDVLDFFSSVDKFPFSTPGSIDAVKKVKDYFSKYERDWLQDWKGPSKEELDKNLDNLVDAIEKEQEALKEYQDALAGRVLDQLAQEMGTCIRKRENELFWSKH